MRLRRAVVLALLVLFALPAWAGERCTLTILHTNDTHGMMRPFDYEGNETSIFTGVQKNIGGMARRATRKSVV